MSLNHSQPFEANSNAASQLTSTRLNSLINVQGASAPKPGYGVRLSQTPGGMTVAAIRKRQRQRLGRFIVTFRSSPETKRLFVSPGVVAKLEPNVLDGPSADKVVPGFPTISDTPLNEEPAPFFDVAGKDGGYEVVWVDSGGVGEIELRSVEEEPEEEGPDSFVIARVEFATVDGELSADIDQLWESDIAWAENGSSSSMLSEESSSSSSESSDSSIGSSGNSQPSDSEKSSNAIVRMHHHLSGYGAMATVESNEVLFDFVVWDFHLKSRVTRWPIDPRWLDVVEHGSLSVVSAPAGDRPYPVAAVVNGDELVLTAWPLLRPRKIAFRMTGIRKGFKGWDMPARTARQKLAAEISNLATYPRNENEQ